MEAGWQDAQVPAVVRRHGRRQLRFSLKSATKPGLLSSHGDYQSCNFIYYLKCTFNKYLMHVTRSPILSVDSRILSPTNVSRIRSQNKKDLNDSFILSYFAQIKEGLLFLDKLPHRISPKTSPTQQAAATVFHRKRGWLPHPKHRPLTLVIHGRLRRKPSACDEVVLDR